MAALCTVLLIRHAAVRRGTEVLWGRLPGVRLSREGRCGAARLALMLGGSAMKEVLSSPRRRAVETARLIAGPARVPVRVDRRLDELDFGEWTGQLLTALGADPRWQAFNRTRAAGAAPGGETIGDARQRIGAALDAAFASGRPLVVMVTHAELIRLALLDLLGRSPDEWPSMPIAPASLSVVQGRDRPSARVCAVNKARVVAPRYALPCPLTAGGVPAG